MRFWKHGAVALLALSAALPAYAQEDVPTVEIKKENSGAGTTSAEFLLMGAGARGMAIGPSFAALTRDVESLYYNPAGLPLMNGMEVGLTMMPYFADTNYMWAGIAMPLAGGEYGFGLSIANFGFSNMPIYTEEDPTGTSELMYGVSETVLGLSFAHAFIDRFTAGATLKLITDKLGQTSANTFALDVGTNYHSELTGRPIALAFVTQNLGRSLKHTGAGLDFSNFPVASDPAYPSQPKDPMPARYEAQASAIPVVFRVGLAYDVLSSAANRLSLLTEFNEYYNVGASYGFGGEYAFTPEGLPFSAALRGNYAYQPDNNLSGQETRDWAGATTVDGEGMDGVTLGGGLAFNLGENYSLKADYAWRNFGVLGAKNVFSVGIGWR
ncbi:MAG: PorV/PorQ family protein [Gemmatimonadetes bacterium]|nr:PorV/PorQ family protein [Gemmatimonadota bacterium]